MVGMASLYEGAIASEERWQGRRAEARRAFMEYQQMYPGASVDDYRAFVDSASDGNSYLRGALPTEQVLQAMGKRNQEMIAQQKVVDNMRMLGAQAQLAGQVDALVSGQILDVDDDNKLLDGVAGSLGYNPNDPNTHSIRQLVARQYPGGLGGMRQRARQEVFEKQLPTIEKIISANPNLTDDQVMAIVPGLAGQPLTGSRGGLIREMLGGARNTYKKALAEQNAKKVQDAVNEGREQIRENGTYTLPALPEGLDAEARRQLEPLKSGYEKQQADKKRADGQKVMRDEATTWLAQDGIAEGVAINPDLRRQFAENIRRAAVGAGFNPDEADVNGVVNSVIAVGKTKDSMNQKKALADYQADVERQLGDPNSTATTIVMPPTSILSPALKAEADRIYTQANDRLANRDSKVNTKESREAVQTTADTFIKDEGMMKRIINDDITPDEVAKIVNTQMATKLGRPATQGELISVANLVQAASDTLESSVLSTAVDDAKKKGETTDEEAKKAVLTGLNGIIDARFPSSDKSPNEANALLKQVVNVDIFGPGKQFRPTQDAVGVLETYLKPEMVEKYDNNPYALANAIQNDKDFVAAAAPGSTNTALNAGFPAGKRRLEKAQVVDQLPKDYSALAIETKEAAREALDDLRSSKNAQQFFDDIALAKQQVMAQAQEGINAIQRFASKSDVWSADGAMSSDETAGAVAKIKAEAEAALQEIETLNAQGMAAIKSLGVQRTIPTEGRRSPFGSPRGFFGQMGYNLMGGEDEPAAPPEAGPALPSGMPQPPAFLGNQNMTPRPTSEMSMPEPPMTRR